MQQLVPEQPLEQPSALTLTLRSWPTVHVGVQEKPHILLYTRYDVDIGYQRAENGLQVSL